MNEGTPTVEVSKTRRQIIERPRLTRLLDASTARIITLVAPAGYGKTTLARQWAETRSKPVAWLSTRTGMMGVSEYAMSFARVLEEAVPGVATTMERHLKRQPNASEDSEGFAEVLLDALVSIGEDMLIVLDDYHLAAETESILKLTERLVTDALSTIMVLSRERPTWATPRRLFYGEVFEIGRSALALDSEEVTRLMPKAPTAIAQGLAAISEGWPAVIALAARLPVLTAPETTLPSDLHEFFAEELFHSLDTQTQAGVELLALVAPLSRRSLRSLLRRERIDSFVGVADQAGFITDANAPAIEMHPLLRSFLLAKIRADDAGVTLMDRALDFLVEEQRWDDALEIAILFHQRERLIVILTKATATLLAAGRIDALSDWIKRARDVGVDAPELDVAAAECAYRRGRHYEALGLALTAAERFGGAPDSAAHALTIAGRSAHTLSDEEAAYDHYLGARSLATSPDIRRVAGWGLLSCAFDMETDDARALLDELAADSDGSPRDVVAHAGRRLNLEARFGSIVSLPSGRAANALLTRVDDPIVRTSFRNVFGYVLVIAGFYAEAADVMVDQFADCERSRLPFALPYAHATASMIASSMSDFEKADAHLDTAMNAARRTDDRFAAVNTHAARSRLECVRGDFDRAIVVASIDDAHVIRSMKAELAAWRGLALVCRGDYDEGSRVAAHAASLSRSIEPRVLSPCAAAIVAIRVRAASTDDSIRALLTAVADSGNVDSFSCAYRAAPELFAAASAVGDISEVFRSAVTRAGDERLLAKAGAPNQARLTRREREVLRCIAQGFSNQGIADELVISLSTAKVHVHHVLEKLGVKTRSAAAARGAIDPSLYAAPDISSSIRDPDASG